MWGVNFLFLRLAQIENDNLWNRSADGEAVGLKIKMKLCSRKIRAQNGNRRTLTNLVKISDGALYLPVNKIERERE